MSIGQNKIPTRLVNFNAYLDNKKLIGVATAEMPELEAMTDTITGSGILGEVEVPILGHFSAISCKITWHTPTKQALLLSTQKKAHALDLRGSFQEYDAVSGSYTTYGLRLSMRVSPKTLSLGELEPAAATDTEREFSVSYVKAFVNNKEVLEFDPLNGVWKVNGVDQYASVRRDLGEL
jgi:P2 family phage contractile tail tube protein